jgi:hypothetical protein
MITLAIHGLARSDCDEPNLISSFSYLYVKKVS